MKKARKTRVTKKATKKIREENKMSSQSRKKRVIPGPWTNVETKLTVQAKLKINQPMVPSEILKEFLGAYLSESNWEEKGWYPIIFNVMVDGINNLIEKHGVNEVMSAIEKSINEQKHNGKAKFGTVILLNIMSDGALKNEKPFMSIRAKTNKKSIENFRAIRKGKLVTL